MGRETEKYDIKSHNEVGDSIRLVESCCPLVMITRRANSEVLNMEWRDFFHIPGMQKSPEMVHSRDTLIALPTTSWLGWTWHALSIASDGTNLDKCLVASSSKNVTILLSIRIHRCKKKHKSKSCQHVANLNILVNCQGISPTIYNQFTVLELCQQSFDLWDNANGFPKNSLQRTGRSYSLISLFLHALRLSRRTCWTSY